MRKFIDLTGQRFGRWTALNKVAYSAHRLPKTMWVCQCDCGRQHVVDGCTLRQGKSTSCRQCAKRRLAKYVVGDIINGKRLLGRSKHKYWIWRLERIFCKKITEQSTGLNTTHKCRCQRTNFRKPAPVDSALSDKIKQCLTKGYTNKQIAAEVEMSINQVENLIVKCDLRKFRCCLMSTSIMDKINRITQLSAEGKNMTEIAGELRLDLGYISKFAKKHRIPCPSKAVRTKPRRNPLPKPKFDKDRRRVGKTWKLGETELVDIQRLFKEGLSRSAIARIICVTPPTVAYHIKKHLCKSQ